MTGAFPAWLEGRMVTNGVPVVAWGPVTLRTAGTANERRGRPSAEPRPLCRLFQHLDVNCFYDLLVLHVWPFQTPSVTVSTSGMALSLPCPPALSDKPALTAATQAAYSAARTQEHRPSGPALALKCPVPGSP